MVNKNRILKISTDLNLLHNFTAAAVKAALYCRSPRGSACVQAASAREIQTLRNSLPQFTAESYMYYYYYIDNIQ